MHPDLLTIPHPASRSSTANRPTIGSTMLTHYAAAVGRYYLQSPKIHETFAHQRPIPLWAITRYRRTVVRAMEPLNHSTVVVMCWVFAFGTRWDTLALVSQLQASHAVDGVGIVLCLRVNVSAA